MEQLRALDASVEKKAATAALTVGILGALILGLGMSCFMVWNLFVPGVVIGVIGLAGVILAYPLYSRVLKKEREKAAPLILKLSEELSQ